MIYFDNSATSYPKPFGVYLKTLEANIRYSFNSGRGGYKESLAAAEQIYKVREKVSDFFSASSPENVVFTKNCTEALNIAIKGSAKKGCHILISSLEHNSVARVVHNLSDVGFCDYDIFEFDTDRDKLLGNFKKKIKPETSLVICTHASNVFGMIMPIREIGEICRKKGITFIVDAAQTAGVIDINADADNIDILCTAGHKGLMGSMGTGIMISGVDIKPLLQGGTGSNSFDLNQPSDKPEGFEAGTLNNSGILSLGAGIDYINNNGINKIYRHEMSLISYLYEELNSMDIVTLYADKPTKGQSVPIISFNVNDYSSEYTAAYLADNGICTRAGFHCAPLAHKSFGTSERGTVRISPGAFNTFNQCEKFFETLSQIN